MDWNTAYRPRPPRGRTYRLALGLICCASAAFSLPSAAQAQDRVRTAAQLGPIGENRSPTDGSLEWQRTGRGGPGDAAPAVASRVDSYAAQADSRPTRWAGTLEHNPDGDPAAPAYVVMDDNRLKQRYVRTDAGMNLDAFVGRPVTVLNDTGLLLEMDQIELRPEPALSRPQVAQHAATTTLRPPYHDGQVQPAAYDEPPPRYRPGDPTVSARNTSAEGQVAEVAANGQDARLAQRIEELPLTSSSGQPLLSGEGSAMSPGPFPGGVCPTCGQQHGANGCACGARGRVFGRAEGLYWWTDGFFVPPLVTTSPAGTLQADAGVLGEPGTSILFGNGDVLDDPLKGARFSGGWWFRGVDKVGVEGDYLGLDQDSFRFSRFANNGSPILARPFFNALIGEEDAQLFAFPNLIEGTITIDGASNLEMAGLRLRIAACCNDIAAFGNTTSRVDFLGGYRYGQLDEQLHIHEDSASLDPGNPGDFFIRDSFVTHNEFHGGEAGVVWEWDRPRFSLELIGRIAVGTNQQDVFINGNTVVSNGGFSLEQSGGILAQRTNIGHYERNRLSVIPELSATVAFKVTRRLRLTAGYTFLYWSNVVRPGDQIDLDLNPNLFPPEVTPFDGPLRPQFAWRESDFWAHGVSAGVDYRW